MEVFARLEEHHGAQVLSRIEAEPVEGHGYVLRVITRCDSIVTSEVIQGRWPDSSAGWTEAEIFMAQKDLAKFAAAAVSMGEKLSSIGSVEDK